APVRHLSHRWTRGHGCPCRLASDRGRRNSSRRIVVRHAPGYRPKNPPAVTRGNPARRARMSTDGARHYGHALPAGPSVQTDGDSSAFIRLDRVYKVHRVGDEGVAALGGVSLQIARGEFAAIVGPSGAGKSTILNLIGGVDTATAGLVAVGGKDLSQLDAAGLSAYRRTTAGFLWPGRARNLIPYLSVAQNAELPLLLAGVRPVATRRRRAADLLELLGLAQRANHLPAMLSGGEQQRAGLVVALAHEPAV